MEYHERDTRELFRRINDPEEIPNMPMADFLAASSLAMFNEQVVERYAPVVFKGNHYLLSMHLSSFSPPEDPANLIKEQ